MKTSRDFLRLVAPSLPARRVAAAGEKARAPDPPLVKVAPVTRAVRRPHRRGRHRGRQRTGHTRRAGHRTHPAAQLRRRRSSSPAARSSRCSRRGRRTPSLPRRGARANEARQQLAADQPAESARLRHQQRGRHPGRARRAGARAGGRGAGVDRRPRGSARPSRAGCRFATSRRARWSRRHADRADQRHLADQARLRGA